MSQWKNDDTAANSCNFAPAQVGQVANTTTVAALYGNTTANAHIAGVTVAQVGVDKVEMNVMRAGGLARPAQSGWVLRTDGSGNRANRVTYEVLVAMKSMTGDGSDDALAGDYYLIFDTQPSDATVNAIANAAVVATFTSLGNSVPAGASKTYFWQKWNGSAFANLSDAGAYSGTATAALSVNANTASNAEIYRVGVSATGATTQYSSNVMLVLGAYTLTVTTQPSNSTINASSASNVATFTVVANSTPTGATKTYFWQKWGGSAFANIAAAGAYSNVTTATLSVLANTASNGEIYRVGIATANVATNTPLYSSNAVITITT